MPEIPNPIGFLNEDELKHLERPKEIVVSTKLTCDDTNGEDCNQRFIVTYKQVEGETSNLGTYCPFCGGDCTIHE